MFKCEVCEKEFSSKVGMVAHSSIHKDGPRYSKSRRKNNTQYNCLVCGSTFLHKHSSKNVYCSVTCAGKGKKIKSGELVNLWLQGQMENELTYYGPNNTIILPIRNYLIQKCGNKCEKCGWDIVNKFTGKVPLQINHIDGDSTNNAPRNLEVICPNCHALTENFGVRGKGRKKRYKNNDAG